MIHFDTDYMEGAHPEVMERLIETNLEQTSGYGTDPYTARAREEILKACGLDPMRAKVHFLIGGTQTNATVIDGLLRHHEGVMAATTAHINVHESGAIEASGHKVLTLPSHGGKVLASDVAAYVDEFYRDDTYEHMVAPGLLYISQPTEYGTLYSLDELKALSATCHERHIPLYIDGARLAYALASPANDATLPQIAQLADAFYLGGTKCGLLFGEAVVVPQGEATLPHFFPLVKQHGALLAKGRLLGVQFDTLFTDDLYYKISAHADAMADRLRDTLAEIGAPLLVPGTTNQVFAILPDTLLEELAKTITFCEQERVSDTHRAVRFCTSWATKEENVDTLCRKLKELAAK